MRRSSHPTTWNYDSLRELLDLGILHTGTVKPATLQGVTAGSLGQKMMQACGAMTTYNEGLNSESPGARHGSPPACGSPSPGIPPINCHFTRPPTEGIMRCFGGDRPRISALPSVVSSMPAAWGVGSGTGVQSMRRRDFPTGDGVSPPTHAVSFLLLHREERIRHHQ